MQTLLTESQELVVDAFGTFFRKESPIERVRAAAAAGGHDADLWRSFRELGGDRVAVADGGGVFLDAVLIAGLAGRSLAPIPYVDTVAVWRLAERLGLDVGRLPQAPEVCVVVDLGDRRLGSVVAHGAVADVVVVLDGVVARLHAIDAAAVRAGGPNLGALPMAALGPAIAAEVQRVPLTQSDRRVWRGDHRLLAAAVLVGAGQQALELAIEHVISREQFGRPIGSFQAVQHRLATCSAVLTAAELLVHRGSSYPVDAEERRYFSAVALLAASDAAELAAREALQFFGGYGYTVEYDIHLYLRFVKAWRVLAADGDLGSDAAPAPRWKGMAWT